jgi:hypothetical protein
MGDFSVMKIRKIGRYQPGLGSRRINGLAYTNPFYFLFLSLPAVQAEGYNINQFIPIAYI